MLLYSLLYLTGYGLTLDDLARLPAVGLEDRGPPRVHATPPGIEVTTGPLGQGFANGVGIGLAEANLRARFGAGGRRPPHVRVLQRRRPRGGRQPRGGVDRRSPRARPPHLRLRRQPHHHRRARPSSRTPTTCPKRFEAYGWHVVQLGEVANDLDALERGSARRWPRRRARAWSCCAATSATRRPSTPTPPRRTASPLGADEVAAVKEILGSARRGLLRPRRRRRVLPRGRAPAAAPRVRRGSSARGVPRLRADHGRPARRVPRAARASRAGNRSCRSWKEGEELATRQACATVVNAVLDVVPGLVVGGADLTENTGMELEGRRDHRHAPVRRSPGALRHPRARHGRGDERHGR